MADTFLELSVTCEGNNAEISVDRELIELAGSGLGDRRERQTRFVLRQMQPHIHQLLHKGKTD